MTQKVIIGIVALLAIIGAYYFLIYKPSHEAPASSGSDCDPNRPGFQKDGSLNPNCTGQSSTPTIQPTFNFGEGVYVKPLRASYMYIYSYPQTNESAEVGRTTNTLAGAGSIGTFLSFAGNGRFAKVALTGLNIEKRMTDPARPNSYYYGSSNISGEYYVLAELIQNKPI